MDDKHPHPAKPGELRWYATIGGKEREFPNGTPVEIDGEIVAADAVSYADPEDKTQIGLEIHSGQNRIVRKLFEKLRYDVKKLDRVYFAGLTKKNLPRGKWRFLSDKEVGMLKRGIF